MKTCHWKIRAFTLTEVLLSVAVLITLMALIFPAFSKLRESSNASGCVANLRGIGVALSCYIQDNNGKLIPYASLGGNPPRYWFDELDKYMGEEPYKFDRQRPYRWQLCPAKPVIPVDRQVVGYGWNHQNLGYQPNDSRGGDGYLRDVTDPSKTIVIGDSVDIDRNSPPPSYFENRYLYSTNATRLARRHGGNGNYLTLDFRVITATPEEVLAGGTGAYASYWKKKH